MKKELPERFKSYQHVWVFIEYEHGEIHPVSLELLGEGRKLADKLGVELAGVVVGAKRDALQDAAVEAWEHGADLVYIVADPILEHYRNEPFSQVLTELVNTYKPEILLLGATVLGRDLAGAVATTLLTGLTADCTELEIDDDRCLAATRPTFGGSLLCTILTLNIRPQMATIRPRVMAMPPREAGRRGRIVEHKVGSARRGHGDQGAALRGRPGLQQGAARLCRYRRGRRDRPALAGEPAARAGTGGRAGRRMGRLAATGAEGLDAGRPADRPDRQNDPAEAVYRRRHIRRHSAPRGGGRGGPDHRDQHRPAMRRSSTLPIWASSPMRWNCCRR